MPLADKVEIVLTTLSIVGNLINGNPLILVLLIQLAYLVVELIGIHMKNKCLILFGCVIRILETIVVLILIIIIFIYLTSVMPAM